MHSLAVTFRSSSLVVIAVASFFFSIPTKTQSATLFSTLGAGDSFDSASRAIGEIPTLGNYWTAMPFSVSQTAHLDSVRVPIARMIADTSSQLRLQIFTESSAGTPDTSIDSILIDDVPIAPAQIRTAISSSRPELTKDHNYWLVLSSEGQLGWSLANAAPAGYLYSKDEGAMWNQSSTHQILGRQSAFSIAGTPVVPEPSALLLGLSALHFASIMRIRTSIHNHRP